MYQPYCRADPRSSWPIETELHLLLCLVWVFFFCLTSLLTVYLDFCFCVFCSYFIFLKEKEKKHKVGWVERLGRSGKSWGKEGTLSKYIV